MKKLLFLVFIPTLSFAQVDTAERRIFNGFTINKMPEYPDKDTFACFLNEHDSLTDQFKWTSGYVVRERGMFKFGSAFVMPNAGRQTIQVTKEYLPLTTGNLLNRVLYKDLSEIKNRVIQVVLK